MTVAELVEEVREQPQRILVQFPVAARVARKEGADPDAARRSLLEAVAGPGDQVAALVTAVYQHGDPAERLAVLHALPGLDAADRDERIGDRALPVVRDALRSNDSRIVAAAMGPYAGTHLDAAGWRQGVLKLVFMGVPVTVAVDATDLAARDDDELHRMLEDFAAERRAAGRVVPDDIAHLLALPSTTDHTTATPDQA